MEVKVFGQSETDIIQIQNLWSWWLPFVVLVAFARWHGFCDALSIVLVLWCISKSRCISKPWRNALTLHLRDPLSRALSCPKSGSKVSVSHQRIKVGRTRSLPRVNFFILLILSLLYHEILILDLSGLLLLLQHLDLLYLLLLLLEMRHLIRDCLLIYLSLIRTFWCTYIFTYFIHWLITAFLWAELYLTLYIILVLNLIWGAIVTDCSFVLKSRRLLSARHDAVSH